MILIRLFFSAINRLLLDEKEVFFYYFILTADGVYMVTNKMNWQVIGLIVLKSHIGTESQIN